MSSTEPDDSVDQIVFRWTGNQGRRGSGIAAAAWSCPQERADDLARELAPLLRVDGAVRPSLVRTLTKRGEAAVIRRWPTTDAGGRPNTACHLLLGDRVLLGPRLTLDLHAWPLGDQRFAEHATGLRRRVEYDRLREAARQARAHTPDLIAEIAEVADALTAATAALLRSPGARLSLRADALPDWPDRNRSTAVIKGLHEIFGRAWLPQPWTFATYDVTDRHDLLVTWVTDWTTDSGRQHPRSRVDPRRPDPDLAHDLAARLVERCLDRPLPKVPGLPELNGRALHDAATWPADQRLPRLARLLGTTAGSRPQPERTQPERPKPERPKPPRPESLRTDRQNERPVHDEERPVRPDERPVHDDDRTGYAPGPHPGPDRHTAPGPAPAPAPTERHVPLSAPGPVDDPEDPDDQGVYTAPPTAPPKPSLQDLHRALHHPGANSEVLPLLLDLSDGIGDGPLLELLREEDLSDAITGRLLLLLHHRRTPRDPAEEYLLCAEVLRQRLYVYRSDRSRPGHRAALDDGIVKRTVWLFGWAVAPYTRDPRHEQGLAALVNALLHHGTAVEGEVLRRLVPPPGSSDPVPDLPPALWRQLLYDFPGTLTDPPAPPPTPPTPPAPAPHPTTSAPPPPTTPAPPPPAAPSPTPTPAEPDPPPGPPSGPFTTPRAGGPPALPDQQARNIFFVLGIGAALITILVLLTIALA
ncbi:hypothetical protein ACWGB8_02345 [Kitasatospora sp. NPDC054939]